MVIRARFLRWSRGLLAGCVLGGCGGGTALDIPGDAVGSATGAGSSTSTGSGATGGEGISTGTDGATSTTTTSGASTTTGTGGAGTATGAGGGGTTGAGGEGPGEILDPNQVYILGTLSEGACYLDALATWSNPNAATVGFDCYFDRNKAVIRPTDGRLIYTNVFEDQVREFHCDGCTYDGTYPMTPLDNDTILPTPPCGPDGFNSLRFLVGPDGNILHTCKDNPLVWYDEMGNVAYDNAGDALLHLGFGGTALTMSRIVDLVTQTSVDVIGMPYAPMTTIRALSAGGFRVVVTVDQSKELWEIDATGVATLSGTYPASPAGYTVYDDSSRIDASGALFQTAYNGGQVLDIIVRREIGGTSDVIYTEATNPLVKLHGSALLTGP